MKLLLDHNLSFRLVSLLSGLSFSAAHVRDFGMSAADDATVWAFARDTGCCIVSKDSDFHERSILFGAPPQVIWIRRGNCSTQMIFRLLAESHHHIVNFLVDPAANLLILE